MKIDLDSLDAAGLDALIKAAGKRRAALNQPHPDKPPQPAEAILDPRWFLSQSDLGALLQVQHPGLGWVSVVLPDAEANHVLSLLLRMALDSRRGGRDAAVAGTATLLGGKLH